MLCIHLQVDEISKVVEPDVDWFIECLLFHVLQHLHSIVGYVLSRTGVEPFMETSTAIFHFIKRNFRSVSRFAHVRQIFGSPLWKAFLISLTIIPASLSKLETVFSIAVAAQLA